MSWWPVVELQESSCAKWFGVFEIPTTSFGHRLLSSTDSPFTPLYTS